MNDITQQFHEMAGQEALQRIIADKEARRRQAGERKQKRQDLVDLVRSTKVFQMNDYDWVAAATLEEATAWYLEETGLDVEDLDGPGEVNEEGMETLLFCDPDGMYLTKRSGPKEVSFRCALELQIRAGMRPPYLFASTEY